MLAENFYLDCMLSICTYAVCVPVSIFVFSLSCSKIKTFISWEIWPIENKGKKNTKKTYRPAFLHKIQCSTYLFQFHFRANMGNKRELHMLFSRGYTALISSPYFQWSRLRPDTGRICSWRGISKNWCTEDSVAGMMLAALLLICNSV